MAFLRFTRDKRGYESTFLLQNVRSDGKTRSRVLYWFRTPPNVKVGRAALDEQAIRLVEEANPDLEIDWTKVLKAKPPRPARGDAAERGRTRRTPKGEAKPGRRGQERGRPASTRERAEPTAEAAGPAPPVAPAVTEPVIAEAVDAELDSVAADTSASEADVAGDDALAEEPASADARPHPVEALVGKEGLARLQARHAELLARITERVTDPAKRERLRAEAAALDPDGWVTAEDAAAGVDGFDERFAALRAALGRRRRSRRGGRRRRGSRGAPDAGGEGEQA